MYNPIDIPFEHRHKCWFCGEPAGREVFFPTDTSYFDTIEHEPICIPACSECYQLAENVKSNSTVNLRRTIKDKIILQYQRELGIGANWTEDELKESDFECAALSGFKKSAWKMYLIAKDKINFPGWELCIDSLPIDYTDNSDNFEFDGLIFKGLSSAINHYAKIFSIDKQLLTESVEILGKDNFGRAVKFCRLNPVDSNKERISLIEDLLFSVEDEINASRNKP